MISNVGPADYNLDETLSTLRYASRAKNIKNKPRINEDPKDAMIREFHDEITRLREELARFSGGQINFGDGTAVAMGEGGTTVVQRKQVTYVENKEKMKEMEDKIEADKKDIRKKFEKQKAKIEAQAEMAAEEKKKLIGELEEKETRK